MQGRGHTHTLRYPQDDKSEANYSALPGGDAEGAAEDGDSEAVLPPNDLDIDMQWLSNPILSMRMLHMMYLQTLIIEAGPHCISKGFVGARSSEHSVPREATFDAFGAHGIPLALPPQATKATDLHGAHGWRHVSAERLARTQATSAPR